jgi:aldehyde dehydrogenase (NAD+)
MNYNLLIKRQRAFFQSDKTRSYAFRMESLNKLRDAIILYEKDIVAALKKDLNKSEFEAYITEIGVTLLELNYVMKHLKTWMEPKKVGTSLPLFKATSYIYQEPYGTVLIMSPWNYPFQLSIAPLIGVIAAGNTAVIKVSPDSPETSIIVKKIVSYCFASDYVEVVLGGIEESKDVLEQRYDYIFFTGSTQVGKIVMAQAAKNLTPLTLELGGKSPAIIDETANLKLTAKRIVYGKFINAGQTCIAPDYVMIKDSLKDKFIEYTKMYITEFFGEDPMTSEDYPKIVNEKNHTRLLGLMKGEQVLIGGRFNQDKIEPTILNNITKNSKIMQEEIFGPILPLITYHSEDDLIKEMKDYEKPLALYLFSKNKKFEDKVISQLSFGGGTFNDTIMHFANHHLPFGGVGASGMGAYHGNHTFQTFSHSKGVVKRSTWIDLELRYPPYTKKKLKLIKKFVK